MQDGDSNKGMDAAKWGTIGQAHLMRDTRKHVFTVAATINHAVIQKQERNAELQPNIMVIYTSTLIQFYFTRLAPHTHIYTKPQRKESGDFPARVESFSRDLSSEPLWRGR